MLNTFFRIRFLAIMAVIGAGAGALLMFLAGSSETIGAYQVFLGFKKVNMMGDSSLAATVKVLSALDQFLFGLVLLYSSYSIYFLFIRHKTEEAGGNRIRIPEWLKVQSLADMKKTLLEVIVVLLAVLFMKLGLVESQLETQPDFNWELLLVPLGVVAIATAIKLIYTE